MNSQQITKEKMKEKLCEENFPFSNKLILEIQKIIDDYDPISTEDQKFSNLLFSRIEEPDIRERLASIYEPDKFFKLGQKLLNEKNPVFIESYLDVFRSPKFLTRIYDDNRWPQLIIQLIQKSNYTFPKLYKHRLRKYADKVIFTVMQSESQKDINWTEVHQNVKAISKGLVALLKGNPSFQNVAFLCENSIEMVYFDLACLTSGIVNIMIPANSVSSQIEYILGKTKPSVIVISQNNRLDEFKELRNNLPFLKSIIVLNETEPLEDECYSIGQLKEIGNGIKYSEIQKTANEIQLSDLASMMFTSGTTGNPKGIMFSHQNIVFKRFARAMAIPEIGENDIFLSYLPLYHTFGRWFEMTGSIFWNSRYVFMENPSVEALVNNMKRIQPTIFISIPKKWYQLHERISRLADLEHDDDSKIVNAIAKVTGGKIKWGLSAAGHLDSEIFQFFQRYGIELMSGFGMTEATGGITMTPPGKYKPKSLGKELPGIDLKIAEDGELLIKGPYVMMGYFNPEESDEDFQDGWLPTGDIMRRDENGFIEIIDRKKEIYKNIKGETIAPQKIENYFSEIEYIKNVFLVGDHRYYNTILIYPNYQSTQVDYKNMNETEIHSYFSSVVVSVNKFLAPFERIVNYRVIDREFDPGKGELTPKGTYRRLTIERNFENVIAPMYRKSYSIVMSDSLEIRIPNWFLRDFGLTSHEISMQKSNLQFKGLKWELPIQKINGKIKIGQFLFTLHRKYLNLGIILNNPLLWLGNEDLVNFTGENIFNWTRMEDDNDGIEFFGLSDDRLDTIYIKDQLQSLLYKNEYCLLGIHLSVLGLMSNNFDEGSLAVEYLENIALDKKLNIAFTAVEILKRTIKISNINIQRKSFCALTAILRDERFFDVARLFIASDKYFINPDVIDYIKNLNLSDIKLNAFTDLTQYYVELNDIRCVSLFSLLGKYGAEHPAKFKFLRQCLVQYQLSTDDEKFIKTAHKSRLDMKKGFREWLGNIQQIAVDVETAEEYTWDDVVIFEEDANLEDKERIFQAIKNTNLIKEAIFLFSKGIQLQLDNIPPGGVWISLLGMEHGKPVYRVSIQTRFRGSFDFALNLNRELIYAQISEEIVWLVRAGTVYRGRKLVEDFGGYWNEYDMWTEEFIHGQTTGKFLKRVFKQNDPSKIATAKLQWPCFIWSGISVYIDFWQRTGRRFEIEDPSIENVIIPIHDYQTGSKIVSIAARKKHNNILDMLINLYKSFVENSEERFPFLKDGNKWKFIFSAFPDTFGIKRGLDILRVCYQNLNDYKGDPFYDNLSAELKEYFDEFDTNGFIPKKLYFAIRRYHRWLELNEKATAHARAVTLGELYVTYGLHLLEEKYPETRTLFFTRTVLENSNKALLKKLLNIISDLRFNKTKISDFSVTISSLQKQMTLDKDELFFLTRLSYPHVKPDDSAEIITLDSGGEAKVNLVVRCEDLDGNSFSIREPVNPKEIARLHQLYINNKLPSQFRPEHQYLIAVNERGYLIGGIFYAKTDARVAHLEKIVVDSYYRKKGVSDLIMTEFFKRIKNMNIDLITTGFFRPEYFYRFDFKIDRKYAGLVKNLRNIDSAESIEDKE